jgi:hypothetical protein
MHNTTNLNNFINDGISADTLVLEPVKMVRNVGVTPAAVTSALNCIERSGKSDNLPAYSTAQEVSQIYGISVI